MTERPGHGLHYLIAEMQGQLVSLTRRLAALESDVDAIDRRARPHGDGTSDRELRREWPNRRRRR